MSFKQLLCTATFPYKTAVGASTERQYPQHVTMIHALEMHTKLTTEMQVQQRDSEIGVLVKMLHIARGETAQNGKSSPPVQQFLAVPPPPAKTALQFEHLDGEAL